MSIIRENILTNLPNPSMNNSDVLCSKIRKHQEAECIYKSRKISKKPLPFLIKHHYQRQNSPHLLLDRQVAMTPIVGAQIDRIWSDINTYYRRISSNDISTIENLVEFNRHLGNQVGKLKSEYDDQLVEQSNITERLNEENYEPLIQILQINPLITHYINRTTLQNFQSKLYEHVGQTSPVYKTPLSSPRHGRLLGHSYEIKDNGSMLRVSPRLHPNDQSNNKIGLFSLSNVSLLLVDVPFFEKIFC